MWVYRGQYTEPTGLTLPLAQSLPSSLLHERLYTQAWASLTLCSSWYNFFHTKLISVSASVTNTSSVAVTHTHTNSERDNNSHWFGFNIVYQFQGKCSCHFDNKAIFIYSVHLSKENCKSRMDIGDISFEGLLCDVIVWRVYFLMPYPRCVYSVILVSDVLSACRPSLRMVILIDHPFVFLYLFLLPSLVSDLIVLIQIKQIKRWGML